MLSCSPSRVPCHDQLKTSFAKENSETVVQKNTISFRKTGIKA